MHKQVRESNCMQLRFSGVGAGLRPTHYSHLLENSAEAVHADWFEAISENYMDSHGRPLEVLTRIRETYPVALHGVGLSPGGAYGVDAGYLKRLRALVDRIEPFLVSDHCSFGSTGAEHLHDLLPVPYNAESLRAMCANIDRAQNALGRGIALENVSSYLTYRHSDMAEWEFLNELTARSGCRLLLDINNVYVNARNHGFDAQDFLRNIRPDVVAQIHLAGHTDMGDYLFDTHSRPVAAAVWDLYADLIGRMPHVPVLIEWDEDIPEFSVIEAEIQRARSLRQASILQSSRADFRDECDYKRTADTHDGQAERVVLRGTNTNTNANANTNSALKLNDACTAGQSEQLETPIALNDLQWKFAHAIHAANQPDFVRAIQPAGALSPMGAVSVYSRAYTARLTEALGETYPTLWWVLGDVEFFQVCADYIDQTVSHSANLSDYGRSFP